MDKFQDDLKKRLCYADLNGRRLIELDMELEEMKKYTEGVASYNQQYKVVVGHCGE